MAGSGPAEPRSGVAGAGRAGVSESVGDIPGAADRRKGGDTGEPRWPMALAVLTAGALHGVLPTELRSLPPELLGDARWWYLVVVTVLLGILIIGDPGRIDKENHWLRALTIGADRTDLGGQRARGRPVGGQHPEYEAVHRGRQQAAHRRRGDLAGQCHRLRPLVLGGRPWWCGSSSPGSTAHPAFVFPEMINPRFVEAGWYPKFVDYLHLSFTAATAFSPTDVSAVKPWAKLVMMVEESISLLVAILVVARAVNILK